MLGECAGHKDITGLRIQRHNETVKRLAHLLTSSAEPAIRRACLIVDGGKEVVVDTDLGCRIPAWVLPDMAEADRLKLRPDIMCISAPEATVSSMHGELNREELKQFGTVYILEVGYHGDTFYEDCKARKLLQHTTLVEELTKAGWTTLSPDPVLFGHGGTVFNSTKATLQDKYKIPKVETQKFLRGTQVRAAQKVFQLVQARRALERAMQAHDA
jgi:hypothetical protein